MSEEIRNLEPAIVWNNFENLNAVPRPSKKEERVIAFMKLFGKELGLETIEDKVGNVIINKPATKGMENKLRVVLQAHLDMVHQKNADTEFDFNAQGIQSYIDGDWIKAKGTTLGADNGMGVAAMMALLQSNDIDHPELTALFTIDEETGMTGAFELDASLVKGDIMLNLDTEDDDELSVGCAGGVDTNVQMSYNEEIVPNDKIAYQLTVKGLKGGHSGVDIHLGRGNANKIMNDLMLDGDDLFGLRIVEINGGSLRNAIPRESSAIVVIDKEKIAYFEGELVKRFDAAINQFGDVEPALLIEWEQTDLPSKMMEIDAQNNIVEAIEHLPNGIHKMSPDYEGLVEASSNLARIIIKDGQFTSQSLQRSSVESSKKEIAQLIRQVFEKSGANVSNTGDYPGWVLDPSAPILKLMKELYENKFGESPAVKAMHAGLECGILSKYFPEMQIISFGPTIRNPHSPDEMVNIKSVAKFWDFLKETLRNIPEKK